MKLSPTLKKLGTVIRQVQPAGSEPLPERLRLLVDQLTRADQRYLTATKAEQEKEG